MRESDVVPYKKVIHNNLKIVSEKALAIVGTDEDKPWEDVVNTIGMMIKESPYNEGEMERLLAFIKSPEYGWIKCKWDLKDLPFEERVKAATGLYLVHLMDAVEKLNKEHRNDN